jgi:hypothetical protein
VRAFDADGNSAQLPRFNRKGQEKGNVVSSDFALFLPFADTQMRFRPANGGIRRIFLILDRGRFFRVKFAIRRLPAIPATCGKSFVFRLLTGGFAGSNPA